MKKIKEVLTDPVFIVTSIVYGGGVAFSFGLAVAVLIIVRGF